MQKIGAYLVAHSKNDLAHTLYKVFQWPDKYLPTLAQKRIVPQPLLYPLFYALHAGVVFGPLGEDMLKMRYVIYSELKNVRCPTQLSNEAIEEIERRLLDIFPEHKQIVHRFVHSSLLHLQREEKRVTYQGFLLEEIQISTKEYFPNTAHFLEEYRSLLHGLCEQAAIDSDENLEDMVEYEEEYVYYTGDSESGELNNAKDV